MGSYVLEYYFILMLFYLWAVFVRDFVWIRIVLDSFILNSLASPEWSLLRRESHIPQRNSPVNDLFDDGIQALMLLGMKIIDVA